MLKTLQILKNKGYSFTKEEEQLKSRLEEMLNAISKQHRLKDKSYELLTLSQATSINSESVLKGFSKELPEVDSTSLQKLTNVLSTHNKVISSLLENAQQDINDLNTLNTSYRGISLCN